jgi:hypothetical protein
VRLPHRNFDAAIARLGLVVSRLDQEVGFAMRGHRDQCRRDACVNQDALHGHRALQPEPDVGPGVAERVGVPDDNNLRDRQPLHGSQDLGNLPARLVGQRVGFELEVQREVLRLGGQRGERRAEQARDLVFADRVDGAGRAVGFHLCRRARRGPIRRALLNGHASVSGPAAFRVRKKSDQCRRRRSRGNVRCDALLGAAAGPKKYCDRQRVNRNPQVPEAWHGRYYEPTRMATVVPRTPTIAAGVSSRMESGASFAMRPET